MAFQQLTILATSKQAEDLSDIFFALGALSVTTEDEFAGTHQEQAIFDEPGLDVASAWEHSKITILLDEQSDIEQFIRQAVDLYGSSFEYSKSIVDDKDWVSITQQQFKPIKVLDNLYIVPSWHNVPGDNIIKIILDPGLAFGTGSHPTTFMCLKWLAQNVSNQDSVLDYGCGSGILAITAKKLGAVKVAGVDIDEQALMSSKTNAINNQVTIDYYLPHQLANANKYSIVVANILSNPLRMLAPALANYTAGTLILSGILASQTAELSAIYSKWFTVTVADTMDEWVLLRCDRHE